MTDSSMIYLKQRFIFGALSLLGLIALIIYSQTDVGYWILLSLVSFVAAASVWELFQATKAKGYQPAEALGIPSAIAITLSGSLGEHSAVSILLILIVTALIAFLIFFKNGTEPLKNISITLFAQIYLAIPLAFVALISALQGTQDYRWWLCYLLMVTKMTDIAAYFAGKYLGKTPFAPAISPNKTWEGAIGGFLFSILTSTLFFLAAQKGAISIQLTLFQSIWLGALISALAIIGDLSESLIKRNMEIKDSNRLPGVGGMLDAIDSLIFTIPALYLFLIL